MTAILSVCHRVAWSKAIKTEWERHQSVFAYGWRIKMLNLKNKLVTLKTKEPSAIRDTIVEHCEDAAIRAIVLKDCPLIEAAFSTDRRIASLDNRARDHFRKLTTSIAALRPILGVNPVDAEETAVDWLEAGAPDEKKRRLKAR